MKRVFFCFLLVLFFQKLLAFPLPTLEDYSQARDLAITYDKPLVVIFSAKKWFVSSKQFLERVLYHQNFADYVRNDYIFLVVDLSERREDVYVLKNELAVVTVPTVILLNREGKEVFRFAYEGQSFQECFFLLEKVFHFRWTFVREGKGSRFFARFDL